MTKEALKLALWHEAMAREPNRNQAKREKHEATAKFIEEALAQPEQKYHRGDRLICLETEEYCVIHISGTDRQWVKFPDSHIGVYTNKQVAELFELLPKEPDQYAKGYADAMNWKVQNHLEHLPAAQKLADWKLVPIEPTREMLEAMDECSIEGYDERLYAGHAASVYMAAVDVAPSPPQRKEPEQEPVAWMTPDGEGFRIRFSPPVNDVPLGWDALYTTPPQRKPLTDEEILEVWKENEKVYPMDRSRLLDRTRACIRKAQEK